MRMVTINGLTAPVAGDQFSDEEVAVMVRMLTRDQIDHEAVCTIGRDRIMHLAQTNAVLLAALKACMDAMMADNAADGWLEIMEAARAAVEKAEAK